MWILVAITFIILALEKLVTGQWLAFFVMIIFAWFAIFLYQSGLDIV